MNYFQRYETLTRCSNSVENLVNEDWFNNTILVIILINTIFLAAEHYDQPDALETAGKIANYIFSVIFFIEMILKLFGLGIKQYVSDGFNVFDAIVVIVSMVELFAADEASGLSVLRAFRLLRIFKIIK